VTLTDKERRKQYLTTLRVRTCEELSYQEKLLQIISDAEEQKSPFINKKELQDTFIATLVNVPGLKLQIKAIDDEIKFIR
jgi:hypothetical protein